MKTINHQHQAIIDQAVDSIFDCVFEDRNAISQSRIAGIVAAAIERASAPKPQTEAEVVAMADPVIAELLRRIRDLEAQIRYHRENGFWG